MRGIIVMCLEELISKKFGFDTWEAIAEKSGLDKKVKIAPTDNIDETVMLNIIQSICTALKVSPGQMSEMFDEYWTLHFAQRTDLISGNGERPIIGPLGK